MESYPIAPDVAKKAAADYVAICRAGMLIEVEAKIREELAYVWQQGFYPSGARNPDAPTIDEFRNGQGCYLRGIRGDSKQLASMLQCDAAALEPHIFDLQWQGPTTRRIVLDVLATFANHARNRLADDTWKSRRTA